MDFIATQCSIESDFILGGLSERIDSDFILGGLSKRIDSDFFLGGLSERIDSDFFLGGLSERIESDFFLDGLCERLPLNIVSLMVTIAGKKMETDADETSTDVPDTPGVW